MDNYKGIYYNETKKQKYFEHGAHFRYKDLFKYLLSLGGIIPDDDFYYSDINNIIKMNKNLHSFSQKEKNKKNQPKTRNILNYNYENNPNTKITLDTYNGQKNNSLSINKSKNFELKNIVINNYYFFDENNNIYCNNYNDNNNKNNIDKSIYPNTERNHININLRKEIFNKKIISNKNNNNTNENNNNNENNNKNSLINFLKNIHPKNKSEALLKKSSNIQIFKNMVRKKKNTMLIKKNRINSLNNNNNECIKSINDINKNDLHFNENSTDRFLNIKKNNSNLVYGKARINMPKTSRLNYVNNNNIKKEITKSRNINNKNKFSFIKSLENIKTKDTFTLNNNTNKNNNIFFSQILDNKTINKNTQITGVNDIPKTINKNPNAKFLNIINNGNNILLNKYIKKRINHYTTLNKNNNSKKIEIKKMSRNRNYINLNDNKQNIKFKTTSQINDIYL